MKDRLSLSVIDMTRSSCLQPLTKFLTYFVNQEKNKTINKRKLMAVNENIQGDPKVTPYSKIKMVCF